MTSPPTVKTDKVDVVSLFKELFTDPLILVLTLFFALCELGNASIFPALINREQAADSAAKAENAATLQEAQADLAEQKSLTAGVEAENSKRKEAALARRAQATALISASEAQIAEAQAINSPVKAEADAAREAAQAELDRQKTAVEVEKAKQAQRKTRAQLEIEQIKLAMSKVGQMASKYQLQIHAFADPTYCLLCTDKHYVPDLPSGAELPPLDDAPAAAPPPKPIITKLIRDPYPWQANSPNDVAFSTWTETLPYGAIAAGGYNYSQLGYCSGKAELETAKQCALRDCGYRNCVLIAQMTDANVTAALAPAEPTSQPLLTRIHKQLFPLGGGCRDQFDDWKTGQAFGAFAVSSEHCGNSRQAADLETAKREALANCGDAECYLVYQITREEVPSAATSAASQPGARTFATVVPEQLNVHQGPSKETAVVGQLKKGQKIEITAHADGDYVTIKATCIDGTSCDGYCNGRAEFLAPITAETTGKSGD